LRGLKYFLYTLLTALIVIVKNHIINPRANETSSPNDVFFIAKISIDVFMSCFGKIEHAIENNYPSFRTFICKITDISLL